MKYLKYLNPRLQFYKVVPCGADKNTRSTNEANLQIARETNSANIAMNEQNNLTQMRLQQEMNEFNSLEQQLKRAHDAGVNPNAVLDGSVSGNLQTSLPNTQAGHADAVRMENPYMEKLATIDQLRGIFTDFFNNSQMSAQTQLTKNQAQAQHLENNWIDDLRGLNLAMGRKQMEVMEEQLKNFGAERTVMLEQANSLRANFAVASEQAYAQALQNYYSEEKYYTTLNYLRDYWDELGLPRRQQLTDDDIKAIYYGYPIELGLNVSEQEKKKAETYSTKCDAQVKKATVNYIHAETEGQYIQNSIQRQFGAQEAQATVENIKQNIRTSQELQDVYRTQAQNNRQQRNINRWMETPQAQTQFAIGVMQDNLLKESATFKNNMEGVDKARGYVGDVLGRGKAPISKIPRYSTVPTR